MILLSLAFLIFFSFFVTGISLSLVFRVFFTRNTLNVFDTLLFGFIAGPYFLSLILCLLLLFFPGAPSTGYLLSAEFCFFVPMLVAHRKTADFFLEIYALLARIIRKIDFILAMTSLVFIAFVFYLSLHNYTWMLVGHDSIIYAYYGQLFAEHKNLCFYPLDYDQSTQIGLNIFHFPGFPLLNSWFALFLPPEISVVALKSTSLIFGFYQMLMVFSMLLIKERNRVSIIFALLLFIFTPVFYFQVEGNSLDTSRICFFLVICRVTAMLIDNFSWKLAFIDIFFNILAIFIHISFVAFIPVQVLAFLVLAKKIKGRCVYLAGLFSLICLFQLAFWNSTRSEGNLPYLMSFNPNANERSERLVGVARSDVFGSDWVDHIKNGNASEFEIFWTERLQCFSRIKIFGFVFYLGLFGIIIWMFSKQKNTIEKVLLLSLIVYSIPIIYKYYMNYRYVSTFVPVMIIFSSVSFAAIVSKLEKKWAHPVGLCASFILASAFSFILILTLFNRARIITLVQDDTTCVASKTFETLYNFANWKKIMHPFDRMLAQADLVCPNGGKILIASVDLSPSIYYYRNHEHIYMPGNKMHNRRGSMDLSNDTSELMQSLCDNKVAVIILDNSDEQKYAGLKQLLAKSSFGFLRLSNYGHLELYSKNFR